MKVVVCIKQTPSTTAVFSVEDGQVSWEDPTGDKPNIVNPWDEYTIEEGIRLQENHGASEVVALTVGDEDSKEVLVRALAMGCDDAVRVSNDGIAGADTLGTARVLAAAIKNMDDVQVAIFGKQAIDGDTGVTAVQTARKLGWTALTFVAEIKEIDDNSITVDRLLEDGKETVTAPLPVVISVVKEINEPRYPSFIGIRKASRAKVPVWSADDLEIEGEVGAEASKVDWSHVYPMPEREGSVEIIEAETAEEQAKILADKLFEEKVI
jgi:electron transfer flavoprotein beta subunit